MRRYIMKPGMALIVGVLACGGKAPVMGPPSYVEPAPSTPIQSLVYLVGDAGEVRPYTPILQALRDDIDSMRASSQVAVAFLGDLAYPDGIRSLDNADDTSRIALQLRALPNGVTSFFIPGNHDWNQGRDPESMHRLDTLLSTLNATNAEVAPAPGCLGPRTENLPGVTLIILDTHAWLRGVEIDGCDSPTRADARTALEQALRDAGNLRPLILAHHPLVTGGPHGTPRSRSGPIARLVELGFDMGILGQDVSSPPYRSMIADLRGAADAVGTEAIYAAGHDHSLQVTRADSGAIRYHLVSGGASKQSAVTPHRGMLFWRGAPDDEVGFMRLAFRSGSPPHLTVISGPADECEDPQCQTDVAARFGAAYSVPLPLR